MEAIILAGGFGTRLAHIVSNVPKPMANVNGVPFLEHLLNYLSRQGISRVILAVGYKKEHIIEYFGENYNGICIKYSNEDSPLLTGGAIKKALTLSQSDIVYVINGDTYFDVPLKEMYNDFIESDADISIASYKIKNNCRYGTIIFDSDYWIKKFEEKQFQNEGYINGGIYLLRRTLLENYPNAFSFEQEILEKNLKLYKIRAYCCQRYFIDIGVPEDYYRAQDDFKALY
jgi:D-glycero-alpha-D-manno-heptose 1-phosphate guanylyltransferase